MGRRTTSTGFAPANTLPGSAPVIRAKAMRAEVRALALGIITKDMLVPQVRQLPAVAQAAQPGHVGAQHRQQLARVSRRRGISPPSMRSGAAAAVRSLRSQPASLQPDLGPGVGVGRWRTITDRRSGRSRRPRWPVTIGSNTPAASSAAQRRQASARRNPRRASKELVCRVALRQQRAQHCRHERRSAQSGETRARESRRGRTRSTASSARRRRLRRLLSAGRWWPGKHRGRFSHADWRVRIRAEGETRPYPRGYRRRAPPQSPV